MNHHLSGTNKCDKQLIPTSLIELVGKSTGKQMIYQYFTRKIMEQKHCFLEISPTADRRTNRGRGPRLAGGRKPWLLPPVRSPPVIPDAYVSVYVHIYIYMYTYI